MRLYAAYALTVLRFRLADDPQVNFEIRPHAGAEINALGFRDREHDVSAAPGVVRIVVLGDSVTYGSEVAFDDRYANRLEVLLTQGGARVEVVNLGRAQYSTAQEVAVFEAVGVRLRPDLVILAYVLNDPTPDGRTNDFFHRLRAPSHALAWLAARTRRWWARPRLLPGCRGHDYYSRMHCDADKWAASEAALDRLARWSRERGVPVLVVIFPLLDLDPRASFDSYRWRDIHRQVTEAATRRGFATLDLLPAFATHRPADLRVAPNDDLHPNALGNQIAAEAIARALADAGLVGPSRSDRSPPLR